MVKFGTTEKIQFVQLWMVLQYDSEGYKKFFTKCLKE